jgi:hypothetical protein
VFVEAMERIEESFDIEFQHVVLNASDGGDNDSSVIDTVRSEGAYTIVLAEQRFWRTVSDPVYEPRTVPLERADPLADAERIEAEPIPADGFGQKLPKHVTNRLTEETDVVFRRGFGIIKGDVLTAPTYGVLSPHGGDLTKYRGKPSGFWEFLNDEPEIKLTMQRLTTDLDAGYICVTDTIDTSDLYTYQEIRAQMDARSSRLWAAALEKILSEDFTPERPEELGPLYTTPGLFNSLRYVAKNTRGRIERISTEKRRSSGL